MPDKKTEQDSCQHRYLTTHGNGWECADCHVGIFSLSVPIPLPLIAKALTVVLVKYEQEE